MRSYRALPAAMARYRASRRDWGEAIGVTKSTIQDIIEQVRSMERAPCLARLDNLLDDLDAGRVRWVTQGRRRVLSGGVRYHRAPVRISVDFLHSRIRIEPYAVSGSQV